MAFDYSTVDLESILQRSYESMSQHQRLAVGHAKNSHRVVDDVWMGLGKTFIGLTAGFCHKPQTWLIICSKNALNAWKQEVKKWYPEFGHDDLFCIVRGQQAQRHNKWLLAKQKGTSPLFYATTGGSFQRDVDFLIERGIKFDVISIDEPQKLGLRNHKTATWKAVKAISKKKYHPLKLLWMGTGSLTSKGVPQLWPYLHLLDPDLFSSYWRFVTTFAYTVRGQFGMEILGPKNTQALAEITSPYIYKVDKKEAEQYLPPINRIKLWSEMDSKVAQMYETMASELFMAWEDIDSEEKFLSVPNPIASTMKLRQLLTCPAIIDPSLGVGGAFEAVADKILEGQELPNWKHNIVFIPFIPAISICKQYLSEMLKMPPGSILTLQGGAEPEDVQRVEKTFRENKDTMVICSLKYSQSFNLETALNMYFPHFEWDQDDNEQAEARGRRMTSDTSRTINSYYCTYQGTVSEDMFDILNQKVRNNTLTYAEFTKLRQRLNQKIIGSDN